MPTDERVMAHGGSDDASFRLWVTNIRQMMEAVGLIRTADTGQIDPTTVLKPVGSSTVAGYDIFRFDDELQATHPVHIKIEYSTGTVATGFGVRVIVGLGGTNGAGGMLTPNFVTNGQDPGIMTGSLNLPSAHPCYASGDVVEEGRMWWYRHAAVTNVSSNMGFAVERTRDTQGNTTPDGVLFTHYQANNAPSVYFLSYDFIFKSMAHPDNMCVSMGAMPSTLGSVDLAVAPFMYCFSGKWYQTSNLYGLYPNFTPVSPVVIERFGEDQVYQIFVDNSIHILNVRAGGFATGGTTLMRFE